VKKNLFYKIFFSYLVIICTSFFILDLFLQDEVKDVLTSRIETELLSYAKIIDQTSQEKALEHLNQVAATSKSRITLIDARGKVFADSEKDVTLLENHLNQPEVQEARLKGSGKSVRFSASLGIDMLYVVTAVKDEKALKVT